ncbi:MAG TPA: formylmethanofuran dehydrogenase subunit C [Burkholderiales bacterium]
MSARILTLRNALQTDVDASALIPECLRGLTDAAIASLPLPGKLRVADLFDIGGEDSEHLVLRNATMRLTHVGARMKTGMVRVEGDCGPCTGMGMRGGQILVTGSAGAYAGCEMRAGILEIEGNVGDFAGSALPGNKQGMRGGIVIVHGNAGDRVGDRMRRGLILVAGDAGDCCGARMLAGTVVVKGKVGALPGLALKRGSLLLDFPPAALPVTFQDSGEHQLLFLTLLEKDLRRRGEPFARFVPLPTRVRRYCGDLATGATGEILVRT